ncbi:MAG TPA: hypothetical protein VK400_13910 [Pyrinomonadaceae bacterium]|nr:hypothetical protein [Pyrinomonadaceae bacterium]
MAQFIRLAVNLQEGRNLDTPDIVYNRCVRGKIPTQVSNFGGLDEEVVLPATPGRDSVLSVKPRRTRKSLYLTEARRGFCPSTKKARSRLKSSRPKPMKPINSKFKIENSKSKIENSKSKFEIDSSFRVPRSTFRVSHSAFRIHRFPFAIAFFVN